MKLTRIAVLGIALGAGVIAALIAMNLSAPAPAPEVVSEGDGPALPSAQVLVAAADLPVGTTLTAASVEWRDWPATGVSDKFIQRVAGTDQIEPIVGAIARATLYAGEPISAAKLIRADQGFMAAILPAGMRAVATRISADTSAGGFILPNDRVDVIMTRQAPQGTTLSGGSEFLTETILNNVRVLAIDQTIEDQDGVQVVVGQTATLELTPQQAQILTVAQQMSDRLTLALRSIADSRIDPAETAGDATHLIGGTKRNGAVTVVKNGIPRDVSGIR